MDCTIICCCFFDMLALRSNYGNQLVYMSVTRFHNYWVDIKAAVNNSFVNYHDLHLSSSPAHQDKSWSFTLVKLIGQIAIKSMADVDFVIKYKSEFSDCVAIFLTFIVFGNTF